MKKTVITIGSILVAIILIVIFSQDKNQNSNIFLVSPQSEVDVIKIDKVELDRPGLLQSTK